MAYKPKLLTVPEGGTGVASTTAYTPICGGTTSTGNLQSVASLETSGYVLKSNGAGALPTFQAQASGLGYVFTSIGLTSGGAAPSDATSYVFAMGFSCTGTILTGSDLASTMFIVPKAGTIKACYGAFTCTVGSNQNATLRLQINATTNVTISSTLDFSSATVSFSNAGLNQAVSVGDFIKVIWDTPTWSPTNPTNCRVSLSVYIE